MRQILPLLLAIMLSSCSNSQEPSLQFKLVYQYPEDSKSSPGYEIIRYLGKNWKTSLKQRHFVYFNGENYYVCRRHGPLQSDKEIKRRAIFVFSKEEASKIIEHMKKMDT